MWWTSKSHQPSLLYNVSCFCLPNIPRNSKMQEIKSHFTAIVLQHWASSLFNYNYYIYMCVYVWMWAINSAINYSLDLFKDKTVKQLTLNSLNNEWIFYGKGGNESPFALDFLSGLLRLSKVHAMNGRCTVLNSFVLKTAV